MKRITALILAVTVAGGLAVASQARSAAHSQRSGALHLTKECSKYAGAPGDYCTIISSNIAAIGVGSRVYYFEPLVANHYDGLVILYAGHGNAALGHCTVDYTASSGHCTLSGGTGQLRGFQASVAISGDPNHDTWAHWDGTYSFSR